MIEYSNVVTPVAFIAITPLLMLHAVTLVEFTELIVGPVNQLMVRLPDAVVAEQPPVPLTVSTPTTCPAPEFGVNCAAPIEPPWFHVPKVGLPPLQEYVLLFVADVPVIVIATPFPVHALMTAPIVTDGGVLQLTFLIVEALVPAQVPLPKTVMVALNEPATEELGVKVHNAGLVVLVLLQEPSVPPPVHATEPKVPETVAPVMGCGALPQVAVEPPFELIMGAGAQFTTIAADGLLPAQWLLPVAVTVRVYCPELVVGVNVGEAEVPPAVMEPVPLEGVNTQERPL